MYLKNQKAFHNASNHHFIIKEFKKQFTCLRKNTEKCITFTAAIEKEVNGINKNGEEVIKNISYISGKLIIKSCK